MPVKVSSMRRSMSGTDDLPAVGWIGTNGAGTIGAGQAGGLSQLGDEAEGGDASPLAVDPYGPGSYVGDEPPEGFNIKGNDRSMKYHVPGSAAYERTIAEVWFDSEDAAQAAGFVRAQR